MNKLLNTARTLQKNRKKGFTLVELIVVIVIIAILVAALTPAILGVINRANRSADESDARAVMMAGSVAATLNQGQPADTITAADMQNAFGGAGTAEVHSGTYRLFFRGPVAIAAQIRLGGRLTATDAANSVTGGRVQVGSMSAVGVPPAAINAGIIVMDVAVNANGGIDSVTHVNPGIVLPN